MLIRLENITKHFGSLKAVNQVSLEIKDGELTFLLGPSGCGKTTLLRLLAGFYTPDSGNIYFGDKCFNNIPPEQRNCGMIFQNYALWPHLTVEQNVAYGLDVRKIPAEEKKERVREALATVRMLEYAQRTPNQLSGGQQQRVALARAIIIRPDLLLLDEPLCNLDTRLRLAMRDEIRRIHSETGLTALYVTHDHSEALSLAQRIAVMNEGIIEQYASPTEIYQFPNSPFVAGFLGEIDWLEGKIEKCEQNSLTVKTGNFLWQITHVTHTYKTGTSVQIGFRPENIIQLPSDIHDLPANTFSASIIQTIHMGALCENTLISQTFPEKKFKQLQLTSPLISKIGTINNFQIPPDRLLIFPATEKK